MALRAQKKGLTMANEIKTTDLSVAANCEALYATLKRNLRRDDFPATPEGWKQWCNHRIRKHTKEAAEANTKLEYWKSVLGGEHLQNAADKMAELAKANAEVAKLQAEIAELKAKKS